MSFKNSKIRHSKFSGIRILQIFVKSKIRHSHFFRFRKCSRHAFADIQTKKFYDYRFQNPDCLNIKILNFTAYTDNELDVSYLMEQAERLDEVLDRNVDLEDELGRVKERLQEVEHEAMVRQVDLENQLADLRKDRDSLQAKSQKVETEYSTLRR